MDPTLPSLREQVMAHAPSCGSRWMETEGVRDLVSVIVPSFNRARFLPDCLRSVTDQTYRPIELILVDDGSSDNTAEVVKECSSKLAADPGFTFLFIQQEKRGANVARNRALIEARGEFIQFLDSDDLLLSHKFHLGVSSIRCCGADYCYCPVRFRDEDLQELPGSFGAPLTGGDVDITTYLWQTMGPIYRRDLIRRAGPWLETIFYADDWEYACRIKLLAAKGLFLDEAGAWLRVHPRPERHTVESRLKELGDYHKAYCNVLDVATSLNRLSPTVKDRIARRFLLNGLSAGAAGDAFLRSASLRKARSLSCLPPLLSAAVCFASVARVRWLDAWSLHWLNRRRNR